MNLLIPQGLTWRSLADELPIETWNIILSLLESNYDKFHLLTTFNDMFKCSVSFDEMIDLDKITTSQWFNNFSNISTNKFNQSFPKKFKYIQMNLFCPTNTSWIDYSVPIDHCNIPEGTTHLTFNIKNDNTIWESGIIPTTCEISLTNNDDEFITKYLPLSLQHIIFKLEIVNQQIGSIDFTRSNENEFVHIVSKNMWIKDDLFLIPINKNGIGVTLTWQRDLGIIIDFSRY